MTHTQLGALIRGLVPALREYLAAGLHPLHERLTAVETRASIGEPGPPGPAGAPGRDGTLEGVTVKQIDRRTAQFCRADGSVLGAITMASLLDCGVYQSGREYEAGDGVTFGGSFFIAQEQTTSKPETDKTWRLAVKHGRDGARGLPGTNGTPGPKGDRGDPGRNFS
jgi:collagen type III alpha